MNALLDHVDLWTGAVKARSTAGRGSSRKIELVGVKKLRELILELAVRGKLVPQDASDEPASELLKRIEAGKAQLIADGKIKKQKPLPPVSDDEKPFELPKVWEWVRFIDVLDFQGGSQPPKSKFIEHSQTGYVQLIQIRDLGESPQPVYVPIESVSKFCTEEDVLIGRYGASVGKVFWGINGAYNVALIKIINHHKSYANKFIYLLMKSPLGQSLFSGISRSAQDGFSKDDIAAKLITLPPLAEQQRIVAKVDELMQLCDQLEQHTEQQHAAQQQLVETLLGALTQASSAADLAEQWQRIAAHFDELFVGAMGEWAVDRLKDSILQLAVMGKLVPQDPNDEPASELLKRIEAEKAQLIKDGKIKKQKLLPPVGEDETPFVLPGGWEFKKVGSICDLLNGFAFKSEEFSPHGIRLLRNMNISHGFADWHDGKFISESRKSEFSTFELKEGDIVISLDRPIISTGLKWAKIQKADMPCFLVQRVAKFMFFADSINTDYFSIWMNSSIFLENIDAGRSNGIPHISTNQLKDIFFSLPPLAEQHRIVAKVDQLFALCDQLKARIHSANQLQLQLTQAVVEQTLA